MEYMAVLCPFLCFALGIVLAIRGDRRKKLREDERMKNIIKQAIEESKQKHD